jgi:hypothetical protein
LDLGHQDDGPAVAFRLTEIGRHLLAGGPAPAPDAGDAGRIVLQPNFHIVAFGPVPELALIELERFADRVSADRAVEFSLSRESVYRAQRLGLGAADVAATLERLTGAALPQNVARSLDEWQAAHERIVVRRGVSLLQAADPAILQELAAAAGGGPSALRVLGPTVALVRDEAALGAALRTAGIAPVTGHDRSGRGSLRLEDDGRVAFRHRLPDIYALGRVQQLAEWDEELGAWRLTAAAARRARSALGMGAPAQVSAWRSLCAGAPPDWLETRVKAWCGHYGTAKLDETVLLELRDAEALAALRGLVGAAVALTPVTAGGPVVKLRSADLETVRRALEELGVKVVG